MPTGISGLYSGTRGADMAELDDFIDIYLGDSDGYVPARVVPFDKKRLLRWLREYREMKRAGLDEFLPVDPDGPHPL